MTTPTPASLAESLDDFGQGFITEVSGDPDPLLGRHVQAMAKRVAARVQPGDPRLVAFRTHTDPSGYVWLQTTLRGLLTQAMTASWSFERWFTSLAQDVARAEPLAPDYLTRLHTTRLEFDQLNHRGLRLVELDRATGAVVFKH